MRRQLAHLLGPALAKFPIRHWPAPLAPAAGVLVPRATAPHDSVRASGGANIGMLLDFLDKTTALQGDVAECGVWRGRTLIAMGVYLQQMRSPRMLWGFDSFQGFQQETPHNFKDTSLRLVEDKIGIFRLHNVRVVPGFFQSTLRTAENCRFSFVHIDCDIYESYKECLAFFFPRMVPNGVILFDEYADPDWPGATQAVNEFCSEQKISPRFEVRDNFKKAYVVKPVADHDREPLAKNKQKDSYAVG
ncbi:MAG TPA: TylF/MycF/NovP-related O-methyltransferase [Candidatus Acidoferrales bacterium]